MYVTVMLTDFWGV